MTMDVDQPRPSRISKRRPPRRRGGESAGRANKPSSRDVIVMIEGLPGDTDDLKEMKAYLESLGYPAKWVEMKYDNPEHTAISYKAYYDNQQKAQEVSKILGNAKIADKNGRQRPITAFVMVPAGAAALPPLQGRISLSQKSPVGGSQDRNAPRKNASARSGQTGRPERKKRTKRTAEELNKEMDDYFNKSGQNAEANGDVQMQ